MSTFIGIFDNARDAQRAVEMLQDSRVSLDDLSIISRASESSVEVSSAEDVSAEQGAKVGAVWGGIVGLASLVIPGVGPFIAGGALATALASAATGAVTGAVVGGVAAGLISFGGISEEEARNYESLVYAGKTLVAVKAPEEDARHVRRILNKAGAESVEGAEAAAGGTPGSAESLQGAEAAVGEAPASGVQVAMYDDSGRRVDQGGEESIT
jgi:uncharacterized membrane protein